MNQPTQGKRFFTHYSNKGVRTFREYSMVTSSITNELVAQMPLVDLMDCDMLANGFDFKYVAVGDAAGNFTGWTRAASVTEVNVLVARPVGFNEFEATNRARLYLIGHSSPPKRIRVQEREGKYFVHVDDLETFWGNDWVYIEKKGEQS